MTHPTNKKEKQGGGIFIAVLAIVGVFAGGFLGQPTLGLLVGLALGGLIALGLWWKDRSA